MPVRSRFRGRFGSTELANRPDHALVGVVRIPPEMQQSPSRAIGRRVLWATLALLFTSVVVWLDRDGYRDAQNSELSYLDALYYSAVTLSTTGYGDITPPISRSPVSSTSYSSRRYVCCS